MLLAASLQKTAWDVLSALVEMTDHISHEQVSLMLLSASRQRTPQGVQLVWVMAVILAVS